MVVVSVTQLIVNETKRNFGIEFEQRSELNLALALLNIDFCGLAVVRHKVAHFNSLALEVFKVGLFCQFSDVRQGLLEALRHGLDQAIADHLA